MVMNVFQVILLSATMPDEVLEVTKRFMREPIRILVKKEELTLEGIRQFYIQVEKEVCLEQIKTFMYGCPLKSMLLAVRASSIICQCHHWHQIMLCHNKSIPLATENCSV